MAFYQEGNALVYQYDSETLRVEPWGRTACGCGPAKWPPCPSGIGP